MRCVYCCVYLQMLKGGGGGNIVEGAVGPAEEAGG